MRWYRKAAEQGDAGAQNNLGVMYFEGWGVPQDNVQVSLRIFIWQKVAQPLGVVS